MNMCMREDLVDVLPVLTLPCLKSVYRQTRSAFHQRISPAHNRVMQCLQRRASTPSTQQSFRSIEVWGTIDGLLLTSPQNWFLVACCPRVITPVGKNLHCDCERIVQNYNCTLNQLMDRYRMFHKLIEFHHLADLMEPDASQLKLNKWDNELTCFMHLAEKNASNSRPATSSIALK